MRVCMCVHVSLCVCASVCAHACAHVCVCAPLCACACARVRVQRLRLTPWGSQRPGAARELRLLVCLQIWGVPLGVHQPAAVDQRRPERVQAPAERAQGTAHDAGLREPHDR